MRALIFLVFAAVAWADDAAPFLEPEKMTGRFALHGGGEVAPEIAKGFRSLAGHPDGTVKLHVIGDDSGVWRRSGFERVASMAEAEAVWVAADPSAETAAALRAFFESGHALGVSGAAVAWFSDAARIPHARAILNGRELPPLTLSRPVVYRIPADAALFFRGRTILAQGSDPVVVCGLKDNRRKISPRSRADHFALVRASLALALDPDFPPAEMPRPQLASGKLILIGGGATPGVALQEFIESAGGKDGHIVVIPTAESDKPGDQARFVWLLRDRGAGKVTVLHARSLEEADEEEFAGQIDAATGIWFGGGRQWRLVDRYFGTRCHAAMRALLARGGVISGSSAGATICGDYLVRGDPLGPDMMMAPGYERGLAFLPGVAVDQHFTQRNRFPDMLALKQRYPQLLGIGLDEATAIVVTGDRLRAIGRGSVFLYPKKEPEQRVELRQNEEFSLSQLEKIPTESPDPFE